MKKKIIPIVAAIIAIAGIAAAVMILSQPKTPIIPFKKAIKMDTETLTPELLTVDKKIVLEVWGEPNYSSVAPKADTYMNKKETRSIILYYNNADEITDVKVHDNK